MTTKEQLVESLKWDLKRTYNTRRKSWGTCVILPSPMLIWVCSHLSAPKYAWLNIGEGEEHIWVRTISVKGEYKKLGENSTQMASVSTICDEYCSLSAVLNSQCVPDSVLVYLVLVTNSNKTSSPSWFDSHAVIVVVQQQVEVY